MISKAIAKMKTGKAARPSGKVIEVSSAGKEIFKSVTNFTNIIIKEGHFFQIGIFFILSVYSRVKVMLSLEAISEV